MTSLRVCGDQRVGILSYVPGSKKVYSLENFIKIQKTKFACANEDLHDKVIVIYPSRTDGLPFYVRKKVENVFGSFLEKNSKFNLKVFFFDLLPKEVIHSENVFKLEEKKIYPAFCTTESGDEKKPPTVKILTDISFAESEVLTKLKILLIQKAHCHNYREVIVKKAYRDHKVFLIETAQSIFLVKSLYPLILPQSAQRTQRHWKKQAEFGTHLNSAHSAISALLNH